MFPKFKPSAYGDIPRIPESMTVVIVDDNPGDVVLIREALRGQRVNVSLFVAHDGDEGIQLFNEIDSHGLPCPDLIILDINLPKRDGFEVLQRIQLSSLCSDKPVVIFSSSSSSRDRDRAERLGAIRYISKPSNLEDFLALGRDFKELLDKSH
jgi:two-component system, chemotaxis family, response regulator Rcp1